MINFFRGLWNTIKFMAHQPTVLYNVASSSDYHIKCNFINETDFAVVVDKAIMIPAVSSFTEDTLINFRIPSSHCIIFDCPLPEISLGKYIKTQDGTLVVNLINFTEEAVGFEKGDVILWGKIISNSIGRIRRGEIY